jgi:hypothetical protein
MVFNYVQKVERNFGRPVNNHELTEENFDMLSTTRYWNYLVTYMKSLYMHHILSALKEVQYFKLELIPIDFRFFILKFSRFWTWEVNP